MKAELNKIKNQAELLNKLCISLYKEVENTTNDSQLNCKEIKNQLKKIKQEGMKFKLMLDDEWSKWYEIYDR